MSRGRNYSNCSQATMDQLVLKERWMDLGVNQEFLEREKAQTTYCRRRRCSNCLTVGRISGTWSRILVRCAMQESLYCDGVFLFSARCTRETRDSLENSGLARELTSAR
jgi:hypothetical protein